MNDLMIGAAFCNVFAWSKVEQGYTTIVTINANPAEDVEPYIAVGISKGDEAHHYMWPQQKDEMR